MTTSNNKIKEARLKAGLTQKAAAEYLEMPLRTFQDWEYGSNAPKYVINMAVKMLNAIQKNKQENKTMQMTKKLYDVEDYITCEILKRNITEEEVYNFLKSQPPLKAFMVNDEVVLTSSNLTKQSISFLFE